MYDHGKAPGSLRGWIDAVVLNPMSLSPTVQAFERVNPHLALDYRHRQEVTRFGVNRMELARKPAEVNKAKLSEAVRLAYSKQTPEQRQAMLEGARKGGQVSGVKNRAERLERERKRDVARQYA